MLIKTVLNRCHRLRFFVYGKCRFVDAAIYVEVRPRTGCRPICSGCEKPGPTYDTARASRAFEFVPLWGYAVFLWYLMRRVDCGACGVTVEKVPWAEGKQRTCNEYRLFLARWARRLPWTEVGRNLRYELGRHLPTVEWSRHP